MSEKPLIDQDKCDGCGLCLSVCECGSLILTDGVIRIEEAGDCDWCTLCEAICPSNAIRCSFEIVIEEQ